VGAGRDGGTALKALPFILASASPRRRRLIKSFPFKAAVVPSRASEPRARRGETPRAYALGLAEKKAREVARRVPAGLVLGADTVVHLGGKILGKPASAAEARRTLASLSGRWHEVHTGLCLTAAPGGKTWRGAAVTRVRMRRFTERGLDFWSLRNHDKAGAYSAQSGSFVTDYRGDFDNVVGLPRRLVRALLKRAARAGFRPA
jgi:septum formation protein